MLSYRKEIHPEDIQKVRDILQSTGFFEQAPDEIDVAAELVETALKDGNNPENYVVIFAEAEGKEVGYTCFARVPCTQSTFEIYWLGMHNNSRGKGYGKEFMQEIIRSIKEYGGTKIVLQTAGREQYLPTQKFYVACGFKEEARLKDYYAADDDCLIFSMDLKR